MESQGVRILQRKRVSMNLRLVVKVDYFFQDLRENFPLPKLSNTGFLTINYFPRALFPFILTYQFWKKIDLGNITVLLLLNYIITFSSNVGIICN